MGRTLARSLGCNEDLTEAICLAHDLGHPPFGHVGEATLNNLMQHHGGYDHQKQTYRIITELERRYPEHPGLNLTYEVREGVVKHDTSYDIVDASEYSPHERARWNANWQTWPMRLPITPAIWMMDCAAAFWTRRQYVSLRFPSVYWRVWGGCKCRLEPDDDPPSICAAIWWA